MLQLKHKDRIATSVSRLNAMYEEQKLIEEAKALQYQLYGLYVLAVCSVVVLLVVIF